MATQDGGNAFPILVDGSTVTHERSELHYGMSLRDWFAGQALAGLLQNENAVSEIQISAREEGEECPDYAASIAYNVADAMLKAREPE